MKHLHACLYVPDFPAAILLRGERNLRTPPLAVHAGRAPNSFVYAANDAARQGGVREGMPLAEATARFSSWRQAAPGRPTLRLAERRPEQEHRILQQLLDLALTISPRVEDAAPGLIALDLAGLPDPHGSALRLWQQTEQRGLKGNVGVSGNHFVALCAARTREGVTHVFPGQEAGFLSVLPLELLPLEPAERQTLARWGISTLGELARLPEDSLVARFGTRGARLAKLARGEDDAVLRPYEPPPALEESMDLDWQVGQIEPLAFILSGLIERLCLKLRAHNLAAEVVRVSLRLADGSRFERSVALSHPLADPRVLLTVVRLDLTAHPPGEAIEGVGVAAQPAPRRMVQFSLFEPPRPSPEKLAVTLARLSNLVGQGRVGAPALVDSHRPGAFEVAVFAPPATREANRNRMTQSRMNRSRDREGAGSQPVHNHENAAYSHGTSTLTKRASATGQTAQPQRIKQADHAETARQPKSKGVTAPKPVTVFANGHLPRAYGNPLRNPLPHGRGSDSMRGSVEDGSARRDSDARPAKIIPLDSARLAPPHSNSHRDLPEAAPASNTAVARRRPLAFRCFRPPVSAEVLLDQAAPSYINAAEVNGPIRSRAGPWRVCGEWWTEDGFQYEEWDIEVKGRLYRLCRDIPAKSWFLAGVYD